MRERIRENLKAFIGVTALIILTTAFLLVNELVAKKLPLAEELQGVTCHFAEGNTYEYTGEAIEPEVTRLVFRDLEGETIIFHKDEITVEAYADNINIGLADVTVSLKDYAGKVTVQDVFTIQPARTDSLYVSEASREKTCLAWEKVVGAEGYVVYRSADNGETYEEVLSIDSADVTTYEDTDLEFNHVYKYYIRVYMTLNGEKVYGNISNTVEQLTHLDIPVIKSVKHHNHKSLRITWSKVSGASGYQILRSEEKDGEFKVIGTVKGKNNTSYIDKNCECGVIYYYQVKTGQTTDGETTYGPASKVMSGYTTPDRINFKSSSVNGQTEFKLKWSKSSGAQGYEIFRSTNARTGFKLIQTITDANTVTWTDTGLTEKKLYYYKIRPYMELDGKKITGPYSSVFTKEIYYTKEELAEMYGDLSSITKYAGQPYLWGGKSIGGWDCSGFTYWVFKNHFGIDISKSAAGQASKGKSISKNNKSAWLPGDILVYSEGAGPSHVAIYLGNGKLIHALSEKYDTIIHDVDFYERWDSATHLIDVRRILN